MNTPQTGEIWKHYKTGGEYKITALAKLQVKLEDLDMKYCVVYQSLSDEHVWVRPLEDFVENVSSKEGDLIPRFSKCA